ncbi:alpha-ketoacid dehydrogenase subunit beta [Intrasporangium calvum]|uniref:Transketolase central region n=1 Tax=Intrasporangium calvum (strain ATCC 23552 / DSM 43043 / JCM 3097 / NBRC 12989 / NCIMB 10167 / NRRL B-3866 / 7 KIP) TaxID=710696 RepID=E6SCL9_INTC7|nr:alpha-ketoacid dehydrogenase subunit beta [Intrasporangium calvum]ADU49623.1 Transketolase central region [Intrasporangium calvum DSM 43043]
MGQIKYWQAINSALAEEMERDSSVCVIGEDVGEPGGPFGATVKLLDRFGEWRVRDTPISEAAIVGTALGAAMTGLRPVAEVMFMDFMPLAMDQLVNQAAKISYMSGGSYKAPMVVRTLSGAGRGTGPQHSQSFEGWLGNVPGLKVVWGSNPADAKGLLKAAIRDDNPVVVIESLSLWSMRGEVPEDPEVIVPIGKASVARPGSHVTVVSWGAAVHRVLAAAEQLAPQVEVEVIDLRTISPVDEETVLESVARTGRLVIVHDSPSPYGPGAEIAALAADKAFFDLKAPVQRVTPPFAPTPFPPNLEAAFFPQAEEIVRAIELVLKGVAQ